MIRNSKRPVGASHHFLLENFLSEFVKVDRDWCGSFEMNLDGEILIGVIFNFGLPIAENDPHLRTLVP